MKAWCLFGWVGIWRGGGVAGVKLVGRSYWWIFCCTIGSDLCRLEKGWRHYLLSVIAQYRFNPRPPLLAGEPEVAAAKARVDMVSIHAIAGGRTSSHAVAPYCVKLFQSTPAIAGGRTASCPRPCRHSVFPSISANLTMTTCVCKKSNLEKIKKPFKTVGCKAREPLSKKAITWGSRR